MILEWRTLFFISSIIRCDNNGDFSSVLFSNSEFLLDILVLDFSAVAIDSGISYKGGALAFLAATIILKSLSYLMLYSLYCFTFYS